MQRPLTSREAQRRTVQLANYEDGLWDILLGLTFLDLSLCPVTRRILGPEVNLGPFLVVLGCLVVGLNFVRRSVSVPRIGIVKMCRTPQKAALTPLSRPRPCPRVRIGGIDARLPRLGPADGVL